MATLCWKLLNPRVKEKVVRGVECSSVAESLSATQGTRFMAQQERKQK